MTLSSVLDLACHFFPDKLIRPAIEYLQRVQILPKNRVSMQGLFAKKRRKINQLCEAWNI
jgi:hypothetical protein